MNAQPVPTVLVRRDRSGLAGPNPVFRRHEPMGWSTMGDVHVMESAAASDCPSGDTDALPSAVHEPCPGDEGTEPLERGIAYAARCWSPIPDASDCRKPKVRCCFPDPAAFRHSGRAPCSGFDHVLPVDGVCPGTSLFFRATAMNLHDTLSKFRLEWCRSGIPPRISGSAWTQIDVWTGPITSYGQKLPLPALWRGVFFEVPRGVVPLDAFVSEP